MSYPSTPPSEQITLLVGMMTGRTPVDTPTACYAAWEVQGYLQGLLIGGPGAAAALVAPSDGVTALATISETEAIAELEKLAGPMAAGPLDAIKAALLKQLLLQVQKWLAEWLAKGGLADLLTRLQPV